MICSPTALHISTLYVSCPFVSHLVILITRHYRFSTGSAYRAPLHNCVVSTFYRQETVYIVITASSRSEAGYELFRRPLRLSRRSYSSISASCLGAPGISEGCYGIVLSRFESAWHHHPVRPRCSGPLCETAMPYMTDLNLIPLLSQMLFGASSPSSSKWQFIIRVLTKPSGSIRAAKLTRRCLAIE